MVRPRAFAMKRGVMDELTPHLWLRAETKKNERRTALAPDDAAHLRTRGFRVTVESSPERIFTDEEYRRLGCEIVAAGSWTQAPRSAWILGLKELPEDSALLSHRHIYFGHAFKKQAGATQLLTRFGRDGGEIWDLEFLADEQGRRLAAFGYWAGYAGAALALDLWMARVLGENPTRFRTQDGWSASGLSSSLATRLPPALERSPLRVLVLGALGRSGRGAVALLEACGLDTQRIVKWDIAETQGRTDFSDIAASDIVVNCILLRGAMPPFLRTEDLNSPARRLRVLGDVSCDPTSPFNPFPFASRTTDFENPSYRVAESPVPLDVIAVDHLPSLLPRESSLDFSKQLTPWLEQLASRESNTPWTRSRDLYRRALETEVL